MNAVTCIDMASFVFKLNYGCQLLLSWQSVSQSVGERFKFARGKNCLYKTTTEERWYSFSACMSELLPYDVDVIVISSDTKATLIR